MESLESRKLLTVTTLTLEQHQRRQFRGAGLGRQRLPDRARQFALEFSGDTGVSANASGFTHGNPNAPNGTQVAFLKNNASMSQSVYLEAGVYNLSFLAAQRVNYQTQTQEIEVLVDGAEVGLVVPAGTTYGAYQTSNFTVAAGHAHRRTPGHESADRRQHGLHRRSGDHAGGRYAAGRRFRAAGPARECLRDRSRRLALAVLRDGRRGEQWQNSAEAQNAPAGTQVGFSKTTAA